jgi:glycosyltransferase involved in cell wall biosynthesis
METICVLMSTFNGEKYISEQLDSLLDQIGVNVDIIIRDDGSTDNTCRILKKYNAQNRNISFSEGENIGYEKSFYSLMKYSIDYDYYAFSDQDDIWDKDKLNNAIKAIKRLEMNKPIVYWCNLRLVDNNLNFKRNMEILDNAIFKKGNYLIDKYGYGCTMVFNKSLRDIATLHEPQTKISHDNWVGLLGVFIGNYIYDSNVYISYRQHINNVTGGDNSYFGVWKRRLKNIKRVKQFSRALVAQEILKGYSPFLSKQDIKLLTKVANYKSNIKTKLDLIRAKDIKRTSLEKNIWFKLMIIFSLA